MIKNIFLLSLRNFSKNKIYTVAILLSLAIGFAISNILIGFTMREINTDSHHEKKDRIYRLISEDPFGREGMMSYMEASIPKYLVDNYPEIETSTMLNTQRNKGISREGSEENFDNLTILTADSSFLKIFDYTLAAGNPAYAISSNNIVLTREV